MRRLMLMAAAMLGLLISGGSPAGAAQLIVNGDFETGDFTGWTALTGAGAELTPWTVAGNGGWFSNATPLSGAFSAFNGFDGDAGLTYDLYQDVTIPVLSTALLTTNHRIVYDSLGIASTLPRLFEINVLDTSNNLLANLLTQNVTINGASFTDTGWLNNNFDLSAFAGMTVRIAFHEFIPETFTGPANLQLDDISLVTTLIPEPSALVLVGVGGLGLLGYGRRRRRS